MKKRFLLLAAMLLTLMGGGKFNTLNAQDAHLGNDGSALLNYEYPVYVINARATQLNTYSLTQQIYLASTINIPEGGTISKIKFHSNGIDVTRNIDVYIEHTSVSSYNSTTILAVNSNYCFSGEVAFNGDNQGWVTIDISDFEYNGEDNILLTIYDKTGTVVSNTDKLRHYTFKQNDSYMSVHKFSKTDTGFDPTNSTTGASRKTYTNEIIFTFSTDDGEDEDVSTAPDPATNLSPNDFIYGNNPQTLSWTFGSNTTKYKVLVGTEVSEGEVVNNTLLGHEDFIEVGDNAEYTVSGLSPKTTYYWQVISKNDINNDINETPSGIASFTTVSADETAPVEKTFPDDGATIKTNEVVFRWSNGNTNHTHYTIFLGTSENSMDTLIHVRDESSTEYVEFDPTTLIGGETYYWRVDVNNAFYNTQDPEVWSFTTQSVGNINGVLKNGDEYFISSATISIKEGNQTIESTTDGNGNFGFNNIAIGEYQLNIVKDGFETYITNVNVAEGDNNITIYMPSIISIDNSWTISGGISNGSNELIVKADAILNSTSTVGVLTIEEGKSVTISNGGILIVNGKINNNGRLIIEDGGQIFQNNEDVQAEFIMNIKNPTEWSNSNTTGWQFISSPFTDAPISNFTYLDNNDDDYDLYKYDGGETGAEWVNRKGNEGIANTFEQNFKQGRAYLASYKDKDQAVLTGELTTDPVLVGNLNYNAEYIYGCFNLLGNPFPYDIEWNDFSAKDIVDGYVVIGENGTYASRISGVIKAGDGFFVKTTGEGDGRAIFNTRTEPVSSQSKNRLNTRSINIIASNNEGEDNVIINLMGKKEGFPKMQNINKNVANIYVKDNDEDYCIYNCDENTTEVELSFVASQMGTYSISLDINGDFENVVLVDRLTGIETNMLIEDEYEFVATSKDNAKRFFIRLEDNSQEPTTNSMFVYQSGEELIVNAEGTIQIIDMMGRVVYSSNADNNRIDVSGLNKSAYIVRNINENTVRTQKIVIL